MTARNRMLSAGILCLLALVLLVSPASAAGKSQSKDMNSPRKQLPQVAGVNPVPLLAYYYIWYDSTSWNRAKIDIPSQGKYTSDDITVMRQHIQEAKAAGITGFIVSWKSTEVLNRRLEQLAEIARQENFKLAIIYQGLDFSRDPLPVDRVASDLDYFIQNFSGRPVFQIFSKPLVIWSGTWKFTTQEIDQVTKDRREKLLLLASERSVEGYRRLETLVDGNAYYWSSVNPATYPDYPNKLVEMSQEIHTNHGLWIAPAAPGFDARLIGGTTIVDRKDGETFLTEINGAMASSPDALGIISWNEFSENSHIEPSQAYGTKYLDILGKFQQAKVPNVTEFDSSIPERIFPELLNGSRLIALGGLATLILVSLAVIVLRK